MVIAVVEAIPRTPSSLELLLHSNFLFDDSRLTQGPLLLTHSLLPTVFKFDFLAAAPLFPPRLHGQFPSRLFVKINLFLKLRQGAVAICRCFLLNGVKCIRRNSGPILSMRRHFEEDGIQKCYSYKTAF